VLGASRRKPVPEDAHEIPKEFKVAVDVAVDVAVEPPTIRKTATDAGGLLGGPAALISLISDMFYATRWASSPTYTFPVRDWGYQDYKFEAMRTWSGIIVTAHALKCDRPAGDWLLSSELSDDSGAGARGH
jgi:hypothetical protein